MSKTTDGDDRLTDASLQQRLDELETMPDIDEDLPAAVPQPQAPRSFRQKLGHLLKSWRFWLVFVLLVLTALATIWFVQPSRLWLLNHLGRRGSLTVVALEAGSNNTHIKHFQISLDGRTMNAGSQTSITVNDLIYGKKDITLAKAGYANQTQHITHDVDPFFGLIGSVRKAVAATHTVQFDLKATGIPVSFMVKDWLSNQPLQTGTFEYADKVAEPDSKGLVRLTVPPTEAKSIAVASHFGGDYLDKTFTLDLTAKQQATVSFVPAGKDYFVSQRTGVYSVYQANLDGSNVQEVIKGTGKETDATQLAVSPSGNYAVLIAARDGQRDSSSQLIQSLYVINLANFQLTAVDQGEYMNFVGWSGDSMVYTITSYLSGDPQLSQSLKSVDTSTNKVHIIELGKNIFWTTAVTGGSVVYRYQNLGQNATSAAVATASINGDNRRDLAGGATDLTQVDFGRFDYQVNNQWYEFDIATSQTKTTTQPGTPAHYSNNASPDGQKRLFVDARDGKNVLLMRQNGVPDKALYAAPGLGGPIHWLNNSTIIFRIQNPTGTADYVVSTDGGQAEKISDVSSQGSPAGALRTLY